MIKENNICPVCKTNCIVNQLDNAGRYKVKCQRCGIYLISGSAITFLEKNWTEDFSIKLSYWIRNQIGAKKQVDLTIESLRKLKDIIKLPKPTDQTKLLLKWIGKNTTHLSQQVETEYNVLFAVIGAHNKDEVMSIARYLISENYIENYLDSGIFNGCLTMKGSEEYEKIKNSNLAEPLGKETGEKDLYALIKGGESRVVEFKSSLRYCLENMIIKKELEHSSFKNIAAFLNTDGGNLLIGVEDGGNIIDLEDTDFTTFKSNNKKDAFLKHFDNLSDKYFDNSIFELLNAIFQEIDDKTIIKVTVKKSSSPVFLKNGARDEFYIRRNASTVQLTPQEMLKYVKEHWRDM